MREGVEHVPEGEEAVRRRLDTNAPDLERADRVGAGHVHQIGAVETGDDTRDPGRAGLSQAGGVDLGLEHGELLGRAVADDHAELVLPGQQGDAVLVREGRCLDVPDLCRRELQVGRTVDREHHHLILVHRLDRDVEGRVERGLVLVGLEGEVLGVDLDAEVDERRAGRPSGNSEHSPARDEVERVVGRDPVPVAEPGVGVVGADRPARRVLDAGDQ